MITAGRKRSWYATITDNTVSGGRDPIIIMGAREKTAEPLTSMAMHTPTHYYLKQAI